jgi:hypothetical protein
MSTDAFELWFTEDRSRWFLVPAADELTPGDTTLVTPTGRHTSAELASLAPFEVSETQARRWAKDDLGATLDELKKGLDARLGELRKRLNQRNQRPVTPSSEVTPDAGPALLDFFRELPGVVGRCLSGDSDRVDAARATMQALQERLRKARIDVDDRFGRFPDRVANLREDPNGES